MIRQGEVPDTPALDGPRVRLEPLRVDHAPEMAVLLDDPDLHIFVGGQPDSPAELEERYRRQVAGYSPDGSQRWLNWVIRGLDHGRAIGTVQATVAEDDGGLTAEIAWIIGSAYQRRGYAREAAKMMVFWLRQQGIETFVAHVHPQHEASAAVARAVGLAPTDHMVDGELRWEAKTS